MTCEDRIRAFIDARAQQTGVGDIYLEIWVANGRHVLDRGLLTEVLTEIRDLRAQLATEKARAGGLSRARGELLANALTERDAAIARAEKAEANEHDAIVELAKARARNDPKNVTPRWQRWRRR